MHIVNIYSSNEYFNCLKLFLFYIFSIIFFYDYISESIAKSFIINFCVLILYYLYCIFLESEFDCICLQRLQIILEKYKCLLMLINLISIVVSIMLYGAFISYYQSYKIYCPFSMKDVDYKLHLKKRCELYNINYNKTLPFQYICSFNAEKTKHSLFLEKFLYHKNFSIKCSKVNELINNNEVIDEFINEYYKEDNLYYCDLKIITDIHTEYKKKNPKLCDSTMIYPDFLIMIHLYLVTKYLRISLFYFNYITANVIDNIYTNYGNNKINFE